MKDNIVIRGLLNMMMRWYVASWSGSLLIQWNWSKLFPTRLCLEFFLKWFILGHTGLTWTYRRPYASTRWQMWDSNPWLLDSWSLAPTHCTIGVDRLYLEAHKQSHWYQVLYNKPGSSWALRGEENTKSHVNVVHGNQKQIRLQMAWNDWSRGVCVRATTQSKKKLSYSLCFHYIFFQWSVNKT